MKDSIEQKCLAKGVKLTDQRKIIAKIMSESNDHPNVDDVRIVAEKSLEKAVALITKYSIEKLNKRYFLL